MDQLRCSAFPKRAMAWEEAEQDHLLTFWEEPSSFPFLVSEVSPSADTYRWPESLLSFLSRAGGISQCRLER